MVELASGRRGFVPRARDQLSADLVHALTDAEVHRVVGQAVGRLTGLDVAWVLRPCLDGSHLHHHCTLTDRPAGVPFEVELALDAPNEPWARALGGEVASGRAEALSGVADHVLWVPMGAEPDRWVLAVPVAASADSQPLRADLRAVADEAWVALQRAEVISDLEGQLEILSAITAVAGVPVGHIDLAAERVCQVALTCLGASVAVLYLHDADGVLRPSGAAGGDPAIGTGTMVAERALADRREVVWWDTALRGIPTGPWSDGPVADLAGLPMRVGDRDVGALVVVRRPMDREWEPLTLQVAAAVAQQAALAMDHAQLLEREQATAEGLRQLDEMKSDWLAGLTHDLKAPLTGLVGFTRTMLRHDDRISADDRRQYLEAMDRQASRLVTMVDDLLLAARTEDGDLAPSDAEPFCLDAVLRDAVEAFGPVMRGRMELEVEDGGLEVRGDRSQVLRLVTNLLDNASKYSGPVAPVVAHLARRGDVVELLVDDHGPGIPEAEREVVFERFGRGVQGQEKKSTGLGLYIGRGIARGHGGELDVEGAPTGGARMRLVLPAAMPS